MIHNETCHKIILLIENVTFLKRLICNLLINFPINFAYEGKNLRLLFLLTSLSTFTIGLNLIKLMTSRTVSIEKKIDNKLSYSVEMKLLKEQLKTQNLYDKIMIINYPFI